MIRIRPSNVTLEVFQAPPCIFITLHVAQSVLPFLIYFLHMIFDASQLRRQI